MDFDPRPISKKSFKAATPTNYTLAFATIPSDTDNIIVTAEDITSDVEIEVVLAAEASADMSVALANGVITVTLGTDATVSPITADDAKNTTALIAAEIDDLEGFTAIEDGDGDGVVDETAENIVFGGGTLGTPCIEKGTLYQGSSYYYVATTVDPTTYMDGWRRFTLSNY